MEINKRCISAFAKTGPFVALATKSKLFDTAFSLTSELILVNYMTGQTFPAITTDLKFCKILWCEFADKRYLVAGHENGYISVYDHQEEGLVLLKSKECLQDDIVALDFLFSKAVLVAASSKGKIIFWTLSNLEKEFALDVPLPPNITAVSCNPKVFKILCVGTSDGVIKVIDIKKLSVILTLNSKEFSEVKQLEWDSENNTKLCVMSEKGFVTVFDLSNDSTSQIGNHKSPLIGFQGSTLVSKTQLETKGVFIDIPESFECSISTRDPVVVLSQSNGITHIMSIPMYKKRVPFCRISNYLLTPNSLYNLVVVNKYEAAETDEFYDKLIAIVNSPETCDSDILGNFILDHNSAVELEDSSFNVDVDINDTFSYELVKNYFDSLKTCTYPIELSILDIIRTKDISRLNQITDFKIIVTVSKLLNDYSALSRLRNPRILAAILIFHKYKDFTPLESSSEGLAIKAILTKDFGLYLDNRSPKSENYLKCMKEYERLISVIQPYLNTKLESKKLSEYFWYQVFMGNLEKVQNLNIVDPEVQLYLQMQNEKNLENKIRTIRSQSIDRKAPAVSSQGFERNKSVSSLSDKIAALSTETSELARVSSIPSYNPVHHPPAMSESYKPVTPTAPISTPAPYSGAPKNSFKAPSSAPNIMTNQNQQFNNLSGSYQQGVPSMPNSHQITSHPYSQGIPTTPNIQPKPSIPTAPSSFQSQGTLRTPHQNFTPPPKSPFLGSVPMNPLRGNMAPLPKSASPTPSMQSLDSKNVQSPYSANIKPPSPSLSTQPSNPVSKSKEFLNVENPQAVVSNFDNLVAEIRHKASLNTSIILKQRKTQLLNALNGYDSLDKTNIPPSILYVIDLVVKRIVANGNNLKSDLSVLVEGYNDIVWLKAFVELVKMVY